MSDDTLFPLEPIDPVRLQVEADYAAALLIGDDEMLEMVGASLGTVLCLVEDLREGYPFIELEKHEAEDLARAGRWFSQYVDRVIARGRQKDNDA